VKPSLLFISVIALTISSASFAQAQSLTLLPGSQEGQLVVGDITRSHLELQDFSRSEQDAIYWNQRYNAAPSGSWEEAQARDAREQAIQRATSIISSPYAFDGLTSSEIESFAEDMNRKYNTAPSGSALERLYIQARTPAYNAFKRALQDDVWALSRDWRELHDLALRLDAQYSAAPSGSQKEAAYNDARRLAYQEMPRSVEAELPYYRDFQEVENLAAYFEGLYNAAPSGSLKESTYRQIQVRSYDEAGRRADRELRSYPYQSLQRVEAEYNQKYNAAPSGSLKEGYFRRVRDLARSLLGYRP
jgi:hypothetical protein